MYQSDTHDQRMVEQRAKQFRGQVERRINGETTELEFKPLRLQNGLYMQLHAYMLRVAVPYGLLNSQQIRMFAKIARDYDKGYGHITTRQNIQFNWPKLSDVPKILDDLASVQMHAIQTSGNCIRNTTSDPFAGVAPDEIEDPRPYCELIRQWSTFHPEFAFLPRKFKIAVTGSPTHDRAAIRYHDIGVRIVNNSSGERGFEIWAGGGLGRTPVIGKVVGEFIPYEHLLSYLEAILRVYNLHGRRDNKYKARIKILVNALGVEEFRKQVNAEWEQIKGDVMQVTKDEIARITGCFTKTQYETLPAVDLTAATLSADRAFGQWVANNVRPHQVPGYVSAVISLKTKGTPPGDVSDTQLDAIADLMDTFGLGEIVATHQQNLVLRNVKATDLEALFQTLQKWDLGAANFDRLTDMICCPGLDFCALANARSIPLSLKITERFDDMDYLNDLGPISLKISGCINACGHHHVGNIGILGIDKRGEEAYQLMLGGCESDEASIGKVMGPAFDEDGVVQALDVVLKKYLEARTSMDENFLQCFRRIGMKPFKEAVYANH